MNDADKFVMVKSLSGEKDDDTVFTYLRLAGNKICRRAFPFDLTATEVPDCYAMLQVEIAVYLLNKRGAEGQTAHTENGVSRSYENGGIPESMLREIVPVAKVL